MVTYTRGNVLLAKEEVIGHCCNTLGKMGSGVAKGIAISYTLAYKESIIVCRSGSVKLGDTQFISTNGKIIANMYAQDRLGRMGECVLDYTAIEKCFNEIYNYCKDNKCSVAFPYKIGCVRAGGYWYIIKDMIEGIFTDVDCVVYEWEV